MTTKQYLQRSLFLTLFLGLVLFSYAQRPRITGAFEISIKYENQSEKCIIHDSAGNIYQCGKAIQKYTASKLELWSVVPTRGQYQFNSICVDKLGNTYVIGSFADSIQIGSFILKSEGHFDIFIIKLNAIGAVVWAISGGGQGKDFGNSIAIDNNGELLVGGTFCGSMMLGNFACKSQGMEDVFLAKMDTTGTFLWTKTYGDKYTDELQSIVCDKNNIFISGTFLYSTAFNSLTLDSYGGRDIFVTKLNNMGDVQWIKNYGGAKQDEVTSFKMNKQQNTLMMGGYITNDATLDTFHIKSYG